MGLLAITPAYRFIDSLSEKEIQSQAETLLAGFFRAVEARQIYLTCGASRVLVDLVEKETGVPFDDNAGVEREDSTLLTKEGALDVEAAIRECAFRLSNFPRMPGVSGGVTFGVDHPANSPKHSWQLYLHRGPFLLLSLSLSDAVSFHPTQHWTEPLLEAKSAHVVCEGRRYFGAKHHIYLLLKRHCLFPYSKGLSNLEAIAGGVRLREYCRGILPAEEQGKPYRLSSWRWHQKRFLRNFDDLLIRQLGEDVVERMLETIGTDLKSWLNASG